MRHILKSVSLIFVLSSALCVYGQSDDKSLRLREFVVMGYQGIRLELSLEKGPYLQTLFDLLGTSSTDAKTMDRLKSLVKDYPNIMDFSDQVLLLQSAALTKAGVASVEISIPKGPNIYSGEALPSALEHLTLGAPITVWLKTGEQLKGNFSEYYQKRLWIRGAARRSVMFEDILALEAANL